MRVFLSYARVNSDFVATLKRGLTENGIDVWDGAEEIQVGESIISNLETALTQSDGVIAVLSKASTESKWVQLEISATLAREISEDTQFVYPVLIEDTQVPLFLQTRPYSDFRSSFDAGMTELISALSGSKSRRRSSADEDSLKREHKQSNLRHQISEMKSSFEEGNLVLVCGAGVSIDAGLPSWPLLLRLLLSELFSRSQAKTEQHAMAEAFQESFRPTALMVAQYLKNGLAKEFLPRLRAALYRNSTRESALVDAIVELCRPRRSRRALHSIVTFNFDDRIERALSAANVHFRSVFREGQRCGSDELPVYHVHGFLPEEGELSIDNEVVFSEDAYHSRFTEPFSWSNLIQLNHLNQNRCLFIGLSLTDPNLRRLLDAAMRKNPDRIRYHYVVKKRYTFSDVLQTTSASEREPIAPADLITIAEALEEQDANNLGLTVIWVDEYSEIPSFLERLAEVN